MFRTPPYHPSLSEIHKAHVKYSKTFHRGRHRALLRCLGKPARVIPAEVMSALTHDEWSGGASHR